MNAEDVAKADLLHAVDPMDPEILAEPFSFLAMLRQSAPVWRDPRTRIVHVSTHALVVEVNKRPKLFSSAMAHLLKSGGTGAIDAEEAAIMAQGLPWIDTMITADPPVHSRYKRIAMKAFTPLRVEAMADYIRETTHRLIDGFAAKGSVEFKSCFADQLPSIIIADMLGVPRSDIPRFQQWLRSVVSRIAGGASREARIAAARDEIALQRYLLAAIEERRAVPRDDVISDLVHATLADEGDPRPLENVELLGILHQIFTAGQETTAQALSYGVYQLLRHPDQLQAARADASLYMGHVEETLRHLTPVSAMWRIVRQDTELGGVRLYQGDIILLRYTSANRDEMRFPDPDAFDLARANARDHLAFGAGIHSCLGMALARKEMQLAFPILFERLDGLRLSAGDSFSFLPSLLLRGVACLNLEFDPK
ncbi:cytochrome P450 [Sphingobium jiangsuense]|uniref:cytochrome P450 n=1 Tax=Sphingobium jiangsuense TaxID=870476 RepID=UPI00165E23A1|nr:cytochrome P450 [Sphingobium jiangsuense]GLS99777.1 cytochrome P450 [Sphingobium jiangsuense]